MLEWNRKLGQEPELSQLIIRACSALQELSLRLDQSDLEFTRIDLQGKIHFPDGFASHPEVRAGCAIIENHWNALNQGLATNNTAATQGMINDWLHPFLRQAPFTFECLTSQTPGSSPLVRMIALNEAPNQKGELLTHLGAVLQYFHTNTPAAVAHLTRFEIINQMISQIVLTLEPEACSIRFYGIGDPSELKDLNLANIWRAEIISPNHRIACESRDYLDQHHGVWPLPTTDLSSRNFVFGKFAESTNHGISICAGMLDYVPKKSGKDYAEQVIKSLLAKSSANGYLIASFIGSQNPHEFFLRKVLNWDLVHRTECEISALFAGLGFNRKTTVDPLRIESGEYVLIPLINETNYLVIARK